MDERSTLPDGYLSMEGGVDSGFVPTLLRENELSWAINATCRGGFIKPRPGLKFRRLNFSDADTQAAATSGLFQGAGKYLTDDDRAYLAYSVAGRVFTIKIDDFSVQEITPPGDRNSPTKRHAWFEQAENTLVVQNMTQAPLLWNGVSSRRSIVATQVPVGGPMAYLKGRLWVARGQAFYGGDLVNSYKALGRESVLEFKENTFLAEGGEFTADRKITGMAAAANIDTTLGDGDLLVFTLNKVYAITAPADRDTWKNLRYPIQRVALTTAGATSHESITNMNSDMTFRSLNGVNSFRYARADFEQWGQTPISRQVERGLKYDTDDRLTECSSVNFDNRMLMTIQPIWFPGLGMVHRGLVALDYHLVSGMGRKTDPAWDGVWTGLKILRILTLEHRNQTRCFIFALDDDNKIALWELTKDGHFDVGPDGEDTRIQWSLETKAFTFGKPRQIKRLLGLEQWYDSMTGEVEISTYFRPNLMECWTPWNDWSDCAKYRDCDPVEEGECKTVRYLRQQVRTRLALPQPPDVVDVQTGGFRNWGYDFQVRMVLTGYIRLNRLVTLATLQGDTTVGDMRNVTCVEVPTGLCGTGDCKELECCDPDDFAYALATPCVEPQITTAELPGGIVGFAYNQTITYFGSLGEFTVIDGALPDGLELSPEGAITGVPELAGLFEFTVQLENECGTVSAPLSISIAAPTPVTTKIIWGNYIWGPFGDPPPVFVESDLTGVNALFVDRMELTTPTIEHELLFLPREEARQVAWIDDDLGTPEFEQGGLEWSLTPDNGLPLQALNIGGKDGHVYFTAFRANGGYTVDVTQA